MDSSLSREQSLIQKAARQFTHEEIEPLAAQMDRDNRLALGVIEKMAKMGYFGLLGPREFGGSDAGLLTYVLVREQVAYAASPCSSAFTPSNVVEEVLGSFGSEEQKRRYLPELCVGKTIGSLVFTEPATGSDPKALTTRAKPEGDHWILNGTKRFHTMGSYDGPAVIFARTDDKVSAFLVEKNCPGYSCSRNWQFMGMIADSVDTHLDNVKVPKDSVVGKVGAGFGVLIPIIASGKIMACSEGLGLAQAALDEAVNYSRQRMTRGTPINSLQAIQWLLAEMAARLEAARWLTYRTASMFSHKKDLAKEAAMAKLFVGRAVVEIADMALQVHGSYGLTKGFKIERLFRFAKQCEVIEGSSEIQRTIIAGSLRQ